MRVIHWIGMCLAVACCIGVAGADDFVEITSDRVNGVKYLNRYAANRDAAGAGTPASPYTGWESALQTPGSTIVVTGGYYETEGSIVIGSDTTIVCDAASAFVFPPTRSNRHASLFEIPAGSSRVRIDGCGFEPGAAVPVLGDPTYGGGAYLRLGTIDTATAASHIEIVNNRFGIMRYGENVGAEDAPFGVTIHLYSVENVLIRGNRLDAAASGIVSENGSDIAPMALKRIQIVDNIFDYSQVDDEFGSALNLGLGDRAQAYPTLFEDMSIEGNQFFNVNSAISILHGGINLTVNDNLARSDLMDTFVQIAPTTPVIGGTISGNVAIGDEDPTDATPPVIGSSSISVAVDDLTVSDNVISTAYSNLRGITVTGDRVNISGNTVRSLSSSGGQCYRAIGDDIKVTGNLGVDCQYSGVNIYGNRIVVDSNSFSNTNGHMTSVVNGVCSDCSAMNNVVTGSAVPLTSTGLTLWSFGNRPDGSQTDVVFESDIDLESGTTLSWLPTTGITGGLDLDLSAGKNVNIDAYNATAFGAPGVIRFRITGDDQWTVNERGNLVSEGPQRLVVAGGVDDLTFDETFGRVVSYNARQGTAAQSEFFNGATFKAISFQDNQTNPGNSIIGAQISSAFSPQVDSASAGNTVGAKFVADFNSQVTGASASSVRGGEFYTQVRGTGTASVGDVYSGYFGVQLSGQNKSLDRVAGLFVDALGAPGAGTSIDFLTGVWIRNQGGHGAQSKSLYIEAQTNGGGSSGNLHMAGGTWNSGHLQLGSVHLFERSGRLAFRSGTPQGATDGQALVTGTGSMSNGPLLWGDTDDPNSNSGTEVCAVQGLLCVEAYAVGSPVKIGCGDQAGSFHFYALCR